jgi:hypothetical protein
MQDWLSQYEDVKFQDLRGADAHKILLFVGIMAAHAVGEGSGVGAPSQLQNPSSFASLLCTFCRTAVHTASAVINVLFHGTLYERLKQHSSRRAVGSNSPNVP